MKHYSSRAFTLHNGTLVTDASALRLGVGEPMPATLAVVLEDETLLVFHYGSTDRSGDDIAGWRYTSATRHPLIHRLLIAND